MAWTSPRHLLEVQIIRSHSRPTQLEAVGVGLSCLSEGPPGDSNALYWCRGSSIINCTNILTLYAETSPTETILFHLVLNGCSMLKSIEAMCVECSVCDRHSSLSWRQHHPDLEKFAIQGVTQHENLIEQQVKSLIGIWTSHAHNAYHFLRICHVSDTLMYSRLINLHKI